MAEDRGVEASLALCVPTTSSTSCDQPIFVDHATDVSVFSDAVQVEIDWLGAMKTPIDELMPQSRARAASSRRLLFSENLAAQGQGVG